MMSRERGPGAQSQIVQQMPDTEKIEKKKSKLKKEEGWLQR